LSVKEQDKVTVSAADDILVYLVYFTDSELPIAVFWDLKLALAFCQYFTYADVDKEIRTARVWDVAGPLFRDRTQFLERITVKNPEDEGLA
jgi:hypothetical protein